MSNTNAHGVDCSKIRVGDVVEFKSYYGLEKIKKVIQIRDDGWFILSIENSCFDVEPDIIEAHYPRRKKPKVTTCGRTANDD